MTLTIAQLETLLEEVEELKADRNFHRRLLRQNKLSLPCVLRLALKCADLQFKKKSYPILKQIDEALRSRKLSLLPDDSNYVCDVCQGKKASYTLTRKGINPYPCVNYLCNAATCGHNDFLLRHNTTSEEHEVIMSFYIRLNNTIRKTAR
jgi:hypothetical protein